MILEGKLTICRTTGPEGDYVSIYLEDEVSGTRFANANLSMEEYGRAITGLGHRPCQIEVRGLEHVGLVRERKHERVAVPGRSYGDDLADRARAAVAPYEVDGWQAAMYQMLHSQGSIVSRGDDETTYNVLFERWVPRET